MDIARFCRRLPPVLRRHRLVQFLLWISPDSRIQLVRFNGSARLFADISDGFQRSYMLGESFDPEFFSLAGPFLSRGGVFLDVGANAGFCTFGLLSALGARDLDCHLIEANGRLCELLRRSAALYPDARVAVVHGCVSDEPGESWLRIEADNLGGAYVASDGDERVANLVLDDYVGERALGRIPLVKMDVEGSEPRALRGAGRSLRSGAIEAIFLEASEPNLQRHGSSVDACLGLLSDSGFETYYVRRADLESGAVGRGPLVTLQVDGHPIRVAPVRRFPTGHQTDLLALHRSALPAFQTARAGAGS